MDISTIASQLGAFTASAMQVVSLLETISTTDSSSGDAPNESIQQLHDSKFELFEAIVELNDFLYNANLNSRGIFPGSLVLAPRYYEGNMCLDFAIVTLIKNSNNDTEKFETQEKHDQAISSTISDEYLKNSNQILKIFWLRPHSRHELLSHSISFTESQLNIERVSYSLQNQKQFLKNISIGEKVLYLSLLNDQKYGTWRKGTVQKILRDGEYVQIEPATKDSSSHDAISSVMLPLKITFIAPLPYQKSNETVRNGGSSESNNNSKIRKIKDSLYDDDDGSDDGSNDGIIPLPSLYGAMLANNASAEASSAGLSASSYPLGLWERHTKGIGGKILAKMGFRRSLGGLGKSGQGILQPIDCAATPLPAGLGLDFVHEVRKAKVEMSEEEANEKKRMKMVQEFNRRTNKPPKNQNNNNNKSSNEETCMFGFLNSLEVKVAGPGNLTSNSSSKSNNSIAKISNAVPQIKPMKQSKHLF